MQASFQEAELEGVHRDPAGNIIGCRGSVSGPAVVVCAHLDTVFPENQTLDVKHAGSTLYGKGIGDNAVALSALLELMEDTSDMDLPAAVWFAATVGEEGLGNLKGMRQLVKSFPASHTVYIVLEGMALGTIYHRALPIRRLRLAVKTAGGHSWVHSEELSAVHELVLISERILNIPLPDRPRTTLNIGTFHGGTSINTRADSAFLEMDLRSEDEQKLNQLEKKIRDVVRSSTRKKAAADLEEIGNRPGGSIPENHPLVHAARDAYRKQDISPINLQIGSTDASIPLSMGLPAVCVGLTQGGGAHSDGEFIRIPPMPAGYAAVLDLIQSAALLASQI